MRNSVAAFLFAAFLLFIGGSASAYSIRDDATGGDCTQIGTWDSATKTCTLTIDLYNQSPDFRGAAISIDADGITLDGNGRIISGTKLWNTAGTGVYLSGITAVTVKNLNIQGFWAGVYINYASGNILSNNILADNWDGIFMIGSSNNQFSANTISGNNYYGIKLHSSSGNAFFNNSISSNWIGMLIWAWSNSNVFTRNNITYNARWGYITGSYENLIYNNICIGNGQRTYSDNSTNHFNLDMPIGGNYWSDFDSAEEGCNDANGDHVCDLPYSFDGDADYLPWTAPDGWVTAAELIENVVAEIQVLLISGEITGQGNATSLTSILESAIKSQQRGNEQAANNILGGFIKQVEAQSRAGRITVEAARQLIDAVRQIMNK